MPRAFNLQYIAGDTVAAVIAAGTTAATALVAPADHFQVGTVTTTNRGVILRAQDAGSWASASNADSTEPLYIYPPTGAAFNGTTADTPAIIPANKSVVFMFLTSTKITANISA